MSRKWVYFSLLILGSAASRADSPPKSPEVLSVFPLGGRLGTQVDVQVRGVALDGAYAVWFDTPSLKGHIRKIDEIELDPNKSRPGHLVELRVGIGPSVHAGAYILRLVTPRGLSNPLPFLVGADPVVTETERAHDIPDEAQPVIVPTVVNGRISRTGELDYYSFTASKGQELSFEVFSKPAGETLAFRLVNSGFDARLGLYEPGGSWFEPKRIISLVLTDEPIFAAINTNPRFTYRFNRKGDYVLEVGTYFAEPPAVVAPRGPDQSYQLRIATTGPPPLAVSAMEKWRTLLARSEWREQAFDRELTPDHLLKLQSRSGAADKPEQALTLVTEKEPNELPGQALEITAPALIQGTIDRPGDADGFKFRAKAGQSLAFEIETPEMTLPQFNPWLVVRNAEGREVLSNVYMRSGRFPNYRKTVQPKTLHTFASDGEFYLQIRDITSRYGNARFRYKILVRPQVPHVGEIQINEYRSDLMEGRVLAIPIERINLEAGRAKKLAVATALEEGFSRPVAVSVEGLPPGVELLPGSDPEPDPVPPVDEGERDKYVPRSSKATLILLSRSDAAPMTTPRLVRFVVREGGRTLPVREIPLMVVGGGE